MQQTLTDDAGSVGELVARRYYDQGLEDGVARGKQQLEESLLETVADWSQHRQRSCWCDACALLKTLAREFSRLDAGGVETALWAQCNRRASDVLLQILQR